MQKHSIALSEERHADSHRSLARVGSVVVERSPPPAGRIRSRWVYDDPQAALRAFVRHVREAA
jgi:hypothetical protein